MSSNHFLVLAYGAQGHMNPALQFSKRLVRLGVRITLVTTVFARNSMAPSVQLPEGVRIVYYSDGYDDGFKPGLDHDLFVSEIKRRGCEALREIISSAADEGAPYTCLVYCLLLPWAAAVARELCLPSALLWIQPATVFDIYYHNYHGFNQAMQDLDGQDPEATITLPGLPVRFSKRDLPSVIMPTSIYVRSLEVFREHMEELLAEIRPIVLVNTFDALEPEALTSIGHSIKLNAIGPLIPSAFLDGQDPLDKGFGADFFQSSNNSYIEWLDEKQDASVIYVSFGSLSALSNLQMEEIGRGLLDIGKPFLWIIRDFKNKAAGATKKGEDMSLTCWEELKQLGLLVTWCSQLQVLSHPAISCFLTHCGWNSTLESLVNGMPIVGFPQWTDQMTNATLVEDFWRTGVRVRENEEGMLKRNEVIRCLKLVLGNKEMRQNAKKWKKLAVEAVAKNGSSDKNLRDFVNEVANVGLCKMF